MDVFERARGHWTYILSSLGMSLDFLRNKHGPCPMCGGKDRFRYDDKDGAGTYICGQCGAGNGIILVRRFKGWDHRRAIEEVEKLLGDRKPVAPKPKPAERVAAVSVERLWAQATDARVVEAYVARRGLASFVGPLRGHPRCPYYVEEAGRGGARKSRVLGSYPAVLAPIVDLHGTLIGVQRVYDAAVDGDRKKVLGDMKGGVVRLGEPDDELAVCEGWETAIAVQQMFGIPTWAALSANNLAIFEPPSGILRLHVFGDNDESSEGQAAAYSLALRVNRRNRQQKGPMEPVKVMIPPDAGTDWLDVVIGGKV